MKTVWRATNIICWLTRASPGFRNLLILLISDFTDSPCGTIITGHKTVDVLAGSFAICVGVLHLRWQQIFHSLVTVHGVTFHLTTLEHAQLVQLLQAGAVNEASVQVGRDGIDGDTGT